MLTEFLLRRIAEDEDTARYALTRGEAGQIDFSGQWFGAVSHVQRWGPGRVIEECQAKALILRMHVEGEAWCDWCEPPNGRPDSCPTLQALALPYVNHPNYLPEWRP